MGLDFIKPYKLDSLRVLGSVENRLMLKLGIGITKISEKINVPSLIHGGKQKQEE